MTGTLPDALISHIPGADWPIEASLRDVWRAGITCRGLNSTPRPAVSAEQASICFNRVALSRIVILYFPFIPSRSPIQTHLLKGLWELGLGSVLRLLYIRNRVEGLRRAYCCLCRELPLGLAYAKNIASLPEVAELLAHAHGECELRHCSTRLR